MKPTSKRGGARPGSGRKPLYAAVMQVYTMRVPADIAQRAREIGAGSLSEGVRLAVSAYPNKPR